MNLTSLTAISPVDGRYRRITESLGLYFSEFAFIRYRILVEIEYFISLCELPLDQLKAFNSYDFELLRSFYRDFTPEEAVRIKEIEKITNHDIKAVEYYLKEKFDASGFPGFREFIHFGLTSQDINNTAVPLSLKNALHEVYFPVLDALIEKLTGLSDQWKNIPMLARTHGQPASPTRLGKEIMVFTERIQKQYQMLSTTAFPAKFGGATGNFNAHAVAYPEIDWIVFADEFVSNKLGLQRSHTTTQIDHYDGLAVIFDNLKRINTILIDLSRDFWAYISMNYFFQKVSKHEVGSSAMPHKINPIDFENAEGNLGISIAIYEHLSSKLPISRLQRDLTDSTVLRNIGLPLAQSLIALKSLIKGLDKIYLNDSAINADLENNWTVVAEGIQTILRRESYPDPYEILKELTRTGSAINESTIREFIESLSLSKEVKEELLSITPFNYTGI